MRWYSEHFPIEAASNVSEYPFGYSETLVGVTPSPGQCADAPRRTRLTAWLIAPFGRSFLHSAQERERVPHSLDCAGSGAKK